MPSQFLFQILFIFQFDGTKDLAEFIKIRIDYPVLRSKNYFSVVFKLQFFFAMKSTPPKRDKKRMQYKKDKLYCIIPMRIIASNETSIPKEK